MPDRSRLRRGREVAYTPTAAEVTALGAGPWPGLITRVNADGTCDLVVDPPAATTVGATLTDPLVSAASAGAALGAFTDPPAAGEMATLRTRVNELITLANANKVAINLLVTRLNQTVQAAGRKASVRQGGAAGQFSVQAGSDSV